MPIKISEKKLIAGTLFLVTGTVLLLKAPLITNPVLVSEKGILVCVAAFICLALAVWFFKQASVKVQ